MDESRRSNLEQQSNSNRLSSSSASQAGGSRTAVTQVKQTQTSGTAQQAARLSHGAGHQDPIQSIANVLNHHHHHLEQQKVLLSSAAAAAVASEESSVENSKLRSNSKSVKQLADQQPGGRSLLLTVDNNTAVNHQQQQKNASVTSRPHQKQQQQQQRQKELRAQADQQVVAVFKQQQQRLSAGQAQLKPKLDQISSTSSSAGSAAAAKRNHNKLPADSSTIASSQQVEQGNSYLYAYNDFITSSSASPVGQQPQPQQQQQQQQQQVVIKQQTTKSNEQQVKTAALNKQPQRDNSKIARQDSRGLAPQVCLLTGETLSPQVVSVGSAIGGRRGLEVTTTSDQRRQYRANKRHLLEGQDSLSSESHDDDDHDDDHEEALSYILNRRQLLAAQQVSGVNQTNLLHLRATAESQQILADADVVAAAAACKQDNLNHLRQYLQIEENFNSYKAARRRRPAAGASEPATGGSSFIIAASNRQVASSHADRQEHQANKQQQQQFLSFQPPPPPTATSGSLAGQGANYLSSSSLSSSQSSLCNQQQQQQLFQTHQLEAGVGRSSYLQFFSRFAPANLLATSGAGQKMYSANNQQVVGTLAGQPGAYYVTTNSEPGSGGGGSDSSSQDNTTRQQLPPHLHHLHHAHLTGGHAHQLGAHTHSHHHHMHHNSHHQHHLHGQLPHHHQHHATVTTSSDSSLGSSGPFAASSAVLGRTTGWLRDFCSKKCIFTSCFMFILSIFIVVILALAYLNFLMNSNRTNLQPLSGRMRVNSELLMLGGGGGGGSEQPPVAESSALNATNVTQQLQRLVSNKTSGEFLQKQRDFETILRGALDRATQPQLKSYPNHLVKLEVYAFKPTMPTSQVAQQQQQQQQPLWVYFRLFINKRTLQQDSQLMRRRAPDEQLESQFLPRLTQQTLMNGFEQLMSTFGGGQAQFGNRLVLATTSAENSAELSDQAQPPPLGVNSRRFGQQQTGETSAGARRSSRAIAARPVTSAQQRPSASPRSQQLKSFDEQISRLMHLIEAIDLQSIFVTPDFDLSASQALGALGGAGSPASMSDTLRASPSLLPTTTTTTTTQPTTTTTFNFKPTMSPPSSVTPITPVTLTTGNDDAQDNNNKLLASGTTATSVKHLDDPAPGTTRKFTLTQSYREDTTRPAGTPTTTPRPSTTTTKDSLFLLKHQQKPTRTPPTNIVRVQSGKPLENQAGQGASERQAAQARQAQEVAQKLKDGASLFTTSGRVSTTTSSPPPRSTPTSGQQQVPRISSSPVSTPVTVEELWQSAFNKSSGDGSAQVGQGRLITVTTIGADANGQRRQQTTTGQQQQPSDWQKVSVLSPEVSNTIRAQLTNELTTTLTPVAASPSLSSSSVRPPKVSPHLNVGGNNGQPAKPARQNQQQQHHHSAVILNRDFATSTTPATVNATASASARTPPQQQQQQTTTTTTHKKKQKSGQQQRLSVSNSLANDAAAATATAGTLRPTRNSTAANGQQHKKPAKVKKVSPQTIAQNPSLPNDNLPSNRTATPRAESVAVAASSEFSSANVSEPAKPTTSVSKGIRIVDNFLASISSTASNNNNNNSSRPVKLAQQSGAADQFVPTTATIELTRGTTALPPASRASSTSGPVDSELQKPPPAGNQNTFVLASQQARPGTTSFSGQWRPLSTNQSNSTDFWAIPANQKPNNTSSSRSPTQARKPNSNLSLIVASERIPGLGQASGSQSPFAMPNSALVMQHSGQRSRSSLAPSPRTTTPSNDFESHRVSRMRQSASHSHRSSDQADPQFGSSSSSSLSTSSTSGSSSSTTVSSLATTSSSLIESPVPSPVPSNMRIVDDFMITTDRSQDSGRGTTLLPPLESGVGRAPQPQPPPISLVFAQGPKRTRGPFAFETLRSFESPPSSTIATGSDAPPPADPSPPSEPFDVSSAGFGEEGNSPSVGARSERSSLGFDKQQQQQQQQVLTDEKLLLRKHLFVDHSDQDSSAGDLSFAPSTNSPIATAAPPTTPSDLASFGEQDDDNDDELDTSRAQSDRFGKRLTTASGRNGRDLKPARAVCPRTSGFGCLARDSGEFTCLSSSQVCDDTIDCQDESDELDCVALQRPGMQTNRMAPSNGAGIIYLNRRGSLAPMCVDNPSTGASGDTSNRSAAESQDELIRQINTIGQYACRLQSFARLVSVKINHHDLVDNANQIRNSKLFHRLAIVSSGGGGSNEAGDQNRISASSTFRSPSAQLQVEISTSSECPSKRTVFVKCGSFECGRDSLQLAAAASSGRDKQSSASERAKALMRPQTLLLPDVVDERNSPPRDGDSPWLVKLYHKDALACHGYLIDESWLVAASECFQSNGANESTRPVGAGADWNGARATPEPSTGGGASTSRLLVGDWTAEISHDDDDDDGGDAQARNTRRRRITDVLIRRRTSDNLTGARDEQFSPIVLAKIERPVRFSLLSRPICLPSMQNTTTNQTEIYRNCFVTGLARGASALRAGGELNLAGDSSTPTRGVELILNKVQLLRRVEDCFEDAPPSNNGGESLAGERNLICARSSGETVAPPGGEDEYSRTETAAARVLICSQQPAASTPSSRWVVVGVEHKATTRHSKRGHRGGGGPSQLFASVSGQIDWIVDTMNPEPAKDAAATDNDTNQVNPNNGNSRQSSLRARSSDGQQQLNANDAHQLNGLNPVAQHQPQFLFNNNQQQQQTCNRFKCSSGECLSWSRICDGLYDCSSHEDEMDCHK